jgi:tRNA (guanine-N1)-methyltransferase
LNEFRRSTASLAAVAYAKKFHETLDVRQGLLDYPHYTRPAEYRGWTVPEVLIGGNHEEIRKWRQQMAFEKTLRNRPDLLSTALLSKVERDLRKP